MTRAEQKDDVFLGMARYLGYLSTCDRKQVGAIITRAGRCVSWGFNGAPPGMPHCDENGHGWGIKHPPPPSGGPNIYELTPGWHEYLTDAQRERMPWDYRGGVKYLTETLGCRNATHAEANALAFAARQGISTEGGTLYVTVSPCEVCARLLIAAGIKQVIYQEAYRDRRGIELLHRAGVDAGLPFVRG